MNAPIDNDLYRRKGGDWWNDDAGEFSSIRFFVNPVRYTYFRRILSREGIGADARLLDVGCGGGILAEEFARDGFVVTGVDPAPESIATARKHAGLSGLSIAYAVGSGEALPFESNSFDVVACCDVLEHVDDVPCVLGEIGRALKPGGLFLYDTVNRTFRSRMAMIKIMQDWRTTAFAPPNAHLFEKFIKPRELVHMLAGAGLQNCDLQGISVRRNPIGTILDFQARKRGEITFKELGERLGFRESADLSVSYMGYAVKGG